MKKKIIIIILLILFATIAIFLFINLKQKKVDCNIDFDKTFNDINEFYMNEFELFDLNFEKPIILININNSKDILYAVSKVDPNEYFVIMKDISEEEIKLLQDEINIQKELSNKYFDNTKIITKSNYTYFVVSQEKTSIIKGIISSNILCENN